MSDMDPAKGGGESQWRGGFQGGGVKWLHELPGGSSFVWWPESGFLAVVSLVAVVASSMEFGVLGFSPFLSFFWACFLLGSVKLGPFGF
ncbi:hypothetical protein F2Q69_00027173 [Brassica cretica]|uniref:Uncharacterized protein n=1 Tax=Brassica cretica TaxID=69181 RepID=A0A8S9SD95_BRACR|nr:hypothetical protein F2Q69_00027173 [Brassica cretica]